MKKLYEDLFLCRDQREDSTRPIWLNPRHDTVTALITGHNLLLGFDVTDIRRKKFTKERIIYEMV